MNRSSPCSFLLKFLSKNIGNSLRMIGYGRRARRFWQVLSPGDSSKKMGNASRMSENLHIFLIQNDLWRPKPPMSIRGKTHHCSWAIAPLFMGTCSIVRLPSHHCSLEHAERCEHEMCQMMV